MIPDTPQMEELYNIMKATFEQMREMEIREHDLVKEAREKDTHIFVSALKEFSVDKRTIAQQLVKRSGLTQREAEETVEQYWES